MVRIYHREQVSTRKAGLGSQFVARPESLQARLENSTGDGKQLSLARTVPFPLARNSVLPQVKCTCWAQTSSKGSWGDNNRWFCQAKAQAQTEETTTSTTKIEATDFHSGDSLPAAPEWCWETRARALEQRYGNGKWGKMGVLWGWAYGENQRLAGVVFQRCRRPRSRGIGESGNYIAEETRSRMGTMGAPHDDDAYAALWRKQARRTSDQGPEAQCRLAPLSWPMAIHWRFHSWARHMPTSPLSPSSPPGPFVPLHLCTLNLANQKGFHRVGMA